MKKVKIIIVALMAIVVFSCDSNTLQEIQPIVANPTFNANVKPIFDAKCVSCHTASGNESPPLADYAQVKDAIENGDVICRIENGCGSIMPPSGKMSQALIDIVNNWKNQGFAQ
ncbi:c-type cytochrome [Flavobacterium sp.]